MGHDLPRNEMLGNVTYVVENNVRYISTIKMNEQTHKFAIGEKRMEKKGQRKSSMADYLHRCRL